MEAEDSLPCLQKHASDPYLEPDESSSYCPIIFLYDPFFDYFLYFEEHEGDL
jgi:hypothetical protein